MVRRGGCHHRWAHPARTAAHRCEPGGERAGASVLGVQRLMGHEKASMTLDVYADLFDHDLDDVATRLDEVRAAGLADYVRTKADARVSESSSEARISLVQKQSHKCPRQDSNLRHPL